MPELKKGYQGPLYNPWYDWAKKYASSYAFLLGNRDGYFGAQEEAFVRELQRRLHIVIDGKFGDRTAAAAGYKWPGQTLPPVVKPRRKIWMWTNPGSGANEFQGPSFQLGERVKNILNLNHQPVHSALGGYLGFMGGPADLSYVEVTWDQYKSIEWLLDNNEDFQEAFRIRQANPTAAVEFEGWFSGYSQKADGLEDALEMLFGDGGFVHPGDPTQTPAAPGKYRVLRDRINGVIQFGNPSTKGTGIARKVRPQWIYDLVTNINYPNDFYAVAKDKIRPPFYAVIIKAEMELPFFVHVLRIAIPVITNNIPIIGGLLGPFATPLIAGMAGLNNLTPLLGGLMGSAFGGGGTSGDDKADQEIIKMLTIMGLINSAPDLIQLVGALPGLQAHGGYEFDPVMMDRAYDVVAGFRRK